jgi:hypothetical protein
VLSINLFLVYKYQVSRLADGLVASIMSVRKTALNQLPDELLSHIFLLGCRSEFWDEEPIGDDSDDDSDSEDEGEDELDFRRLVSHVCSRWRRVAISTAALWSRVQSDPRSDEAREFIFRSKGHPLDFDADWSETVSSREDMREILNLIWPLLPQWRTFSIITDEIIPFVEFLAWCKEASNQASILEDLCLCCNNDSEISEDLLNEMNKYPIPSGFAPNLKAFELRATPIQWAGGTIQGTGSLHLPPFTNLVRLELSHHAENARPTLAQFLNLLSCSPALEMLELRDSGPVSLADENMGGSSWIAGHQISLPSLNSLTIAFFEDSDYICSLLRLIKAPNLIALALQDLFGADFSRPLSYLAGTWAPTSERGDSSANISPKPPFPLVKVLKLVDIDASADQAAFAALLRALEHITHLHIECDDLHIDSIDRYPLTQRPKPLPLVCPRLEELTCSRIPGRKLAGFVERRLSAKSTVLRRIRIDRRDRRIVKRDLLSLREKVGIVEFFRHEDEGDSSTENEDEDVGEEDDEDEDEE